MRSRVIPGSSPTIDRRVPVSRLNSVLLPTFGRPQIATSGSSAHRRTRSLSPSAKPAAQHRAIFLSIRSRPATFADRGVCRPTFPSAGRAQLRTRRRSRLLRRSHPGRIAFRLSRSGDRFGTRAAFSAAARFVERTLRFRGSTAPVVARSAGAPSSAACSPAGASCLTSSYRLVGHECPTFSRAPSRRPGSSAIDSLSSLL